MHTHRACSLPFQLRERFDGLMKKKIYRAAEKSYQQFKSSALYFIHKDEWKLNYHGTIRKKLTSQRHISVTSQITGPEESTDNKERKYLYL